MDLKKGLIYKLTDNTNGNVYIGSTQQNLSTRISIHKAQYRQYLLNKTNHLTAFEIIKNNNFTAEILEELEFNDRKQLNQLEGHYQKITQNCINHNIAGRTNKQYIKDNWETFKVILNKSYHKNIVKRREYQIKYYQSKKDERQEYQRDYYNRTKLQLSNDTI